MRAADQSKAARRRKLAAESVAISELTNRLTGALATPSNRWGVGSLAEWVQWGVIAMHVLEATPDERTEWAGWVAARDLLEKPEGIQRIEEKLADVFLNGRPRRKRKQQTEEAA